MPFINPRRTVGDLGEASLRPYRWNVVLANILVITLAIAACTPSPAAPTSTPSREELQQQPTAPPPEWQEPFTPITLNNIEAVQQVGRLDSTIAEGGSIYAHAFSIDGTRLAALNNAQLLAWDIITGELVFFITHENALDVFYSPDKTEIYTIDTNGTVSIHNGETGFLQNTFQTHPDFVTGSEFAYHANNGILAVVSIQGDIRVWDTLERQAVANIETANPEINSITFSDDGDLIAVGSNDSGAVNIWRWRDEEQVATLATDAAPSVVHLAFSPEAEQMAVATNEDIRVWDIAEASVKHVLLTGQGGSSDVLTFTRDGTYIINSGLAEAMNLWETATGELAMALPELGGEPTAVAFSPDGELMLTSVFQGDVLVWNLTTVGKGQLARAELDVDANIIDVAWSDDGRTIALFDARGSVYIWGIPQPPMTEEPTS